jgi:transposase
MSLTDTTRPTPGNSAGVDWAKDDYAVCVVDPEGEPLEGVTLRYTKAGLRRLIDVLNRYRVDAVGIERGDGPIVDALLAAARTVYVIPPSQVKALRRRYGSAGNKDDRFDAYVLADTVRTDRRRLTALVLDSEATTALRKLCRARKDLVAHRIAVANQLRAHLATALPAAVDMFRDIDSTISLRFLTRFTTQNALDWLSPKRLAAWLRSVGYCGRTNPAVLHARISAAPAGPTGEHGQALAGITHAYLATLTAITAQIQALAQQITEALQLHPDRDIFTTLPKAGTIRAARDR